MKTALCLYGQARDFIKNEPFLSSNIILPNNTDLFFHTWHDKENLNINKMTPGHEHRKLEQNIDELLIHLLKPKSYIIEKQLNFNRKEVYCSDENFFACWPWAVGYNRKEFLKDRVFSHYSMWYSINQSLLLKEKFAQKNGFEYDCVIVSRFDVSPKTKVEVEKMNLKNLISGTSMLPRSEVSDWFFICNNKNSNIIATLFFLIDFHRDNIIKNGGIWTNESYFREHLRLFNINVDFHNLQITF